MTTYDVSLDDGRAAEFITELWRRAGMPSSGPHSSAMSMLLVYLMNTDPSVPAMTLSYEFGPGARLREYTLRADDGRLLVCTAFRPDGSVVPEQPDGDGDGEPKPQ
jgi:hypothetical protein